ncbi:hypothetical protein ABTZ58_34810 [Streptomyces sp. NPDC094143]|uniref:hypothetical protein n=1 Tax=Streptomyces sp. NPDC094143 TaxID=3155310 RepID=UPI0033325B1D
MRHDENGGFRASPGGSPEWGEDHATVTLRQLREELGSDEHAAEPGAPRWVDLYRGQVPRHSPLLTASLRRRP